ncbi:hypothetical protein CONPUDRAFT_166305 [Coniophora puteana RWD-64-598 SS2]|uniref:O-methyltransferase C-terminal domain-containing protein n=1 Tax=Coniophora puteana (strain RWD-64-598) TaxID=741705 RepID=A0A5M3MK06_CONPW|nr:uncharacterized protein CONPUDRAFT_166305 [Coniophora puteana RWD-64-598 SS2]EIW79552.1 hypothetical protein CONPUDRAFT_166305 [Coniophora puteana RWD-64-598 SS2]
MRDTHRTPPTSTSGEPAGKPPMSPLPTFDTLRALHNIIGEALDDIERVFASAGSTHSRLSASKSHTWTFCPSVDYPSPNSAFAPSSEAEKLARDPVAAAASLRIISAVGEFEGILRPPFLALSIASMSYNLPACLRLVEHAHIVEILRENEAPRADVVGMHADEISRIIRGYCGEEKFCDGAQLAHFLRLLCTHHILRETAPNVFANTRISSTMDTGKTVKSCFEAPRDKYDGTDGTAAFVGLCTDELFKAAAYLTEGVTSGCSPDPSNTKKSAFNVALQTHSPYFEWLEAGGLDITGGDGCGASAGVRDAANDRASFHTGTGSAKDVTSYRLDRFSRGMTGTSGWEAPGAILNALDWAALPSGSTIVDVGGGIGSTVMVLAEALETNEGNGHATSSSRVSRRNLRYIVQDRPVVVALGRESWQARHPALIEDGTVRLQEHDFFKPQPVQAPAVFVLRVVLHDWEDNDAAKILRRLRSAAGRDTKLIIAENVLPLACADDLTVNHPDQEGYNAGENTEWTLQRVLESIEGAPRSLAPPPLLPNLGRASVNTYWMDLTMYNMFRSKERTLRELCELALSAGWRAVRLVRSEGWLFGHLICEPVDVPEGLEDHSYSTSAETSAGDMTDNQTSPATTDVTDMNEAKFGVLLEPPLLTEPMTRSRRCSSSTGTFSFVHLNRPTPNSSGTMLCSHVSLASLTDLRFQSQTQAHVVATEPESPGSGKFRSLRRLGRQRMRTCSTENMSTPPSSPLQHQSPWWRRVFTHSPTQTSPCSPPGLGGCEGAYAPMVVAGEEDDMPRLIEDEDYGEEGHEFGSSNGRAASTQAGVPSGREQRAASRRPSIAHLKRRLNFALQISTGRETSKKRSTEDVGGDGGRCQRLPKCSASPVGLVPPSPVLELERMPSLEELGGGELNRTLRAPCLSVDPVRWHGPARRKSLPSLWMKPEIGVQEVEEVQ